MSDQTPKRAIPAQVGFLAIYNPSLGTTDETVGDQIVYYFPRSSNSDQRRRQQTDSRLEDAAREERNLQLRQIGLAQGMVEFGRTFSDGRAVNTVETEKSRIILQELEAGWWMLASISLTVLPSKVNNGSTKGTETNKNGDPEYSSREVKPSILLLGDLLRAHSTFLLHHASSLSALFVRTRRSKFISILGRYWDMFIPSWNVLMHGNPANSLYGGIKIAACGELGVGVGEEERGSGEREVLEGFVGRVHGLVDVVVSKFGEVDSIETSSTFESKDGASQHPTRPWLGSGGDPAAEDGVIFLGTGALSRKSLRDVSHWIEDVYRWGPSAYGVRENPTSTRSARRSKDRAKSLTSDAKKKARQVYGLEPLDTHSQEEPIATIPPVPINDNEESKAIVNQKTRPGPLRRGTSSGKSTDGEAKKNSGFTRYLKFGYGTHWSLGISDAKAEGESASAQPQTTSGAISAFEHQSDSAKPLSVGDRSKPTGAPDPIVTSSTDFVSSQNDSRGRFLIGLLGDLENDHEHAEHRREDMTADLTNDSGSEDDNPRLVLRTLTLESEREEDARDKADISIDLGITEDENPPQSGSEHSNSGPVFENLDRNKTKKVRVVVYVNKPFIFVFLFELRENALALHGLYHSLHLQIEPLLKPLRTSTAFRASRPDMTPAAAEQRSNAPIYDLVWDPNLLTVNSTIPNIPDPFQTQFELEASPWSRIEALNTHMQILNTYTTTINEKVEMERTAKTSRGWWVVWTRIPEQHRAAFEPPKGAEQLASSDNHSSESTHAKNDSVDKRRPNTHVGSSVTSGAAHPYLDIPSDVQNAVPKDKEIFLIRRASDYVLTKSSGRVFSGSSMGGETGWGSTTAKLAQGIGIDTKRYIEGLLNLNR